MDDRSRGRDVRRDPAFFGRQEELLRLVKNLLEGRHTLITGDFGIGKRRLMQEARLIITGERIRLDLPPVVPPWPRGAMLTIQCPVPRGACLREAGEALYRNGDLRLESEDGREDWGAVRSRFTELGVDGMEAEVIRALAASARRYIAFVAGLERVTVHCTKFLDALLHLTTVCGSATVTKDVEAFRCFWSSFERLSLGPLPEQDARRMVRHLMCEYDITASDPLMCMREILASADGSPFHIRNLVHRARTRQPLREGDIRGFRSAEEGRYFNMGPLYMIGAGALAAVKFFSSGADRREHYIYFSAIAFILYLTFRAFRGFFIFRPQRRK